MDKFLLNHIKEIEEILTQTKQKEEKLKKVSMNLKKMCQSLLELNLVNKDVKEKISKYISMLNSNLEIKSFDTLYKNNRLDKKMFFELLEKVDFSKNLFFIFKLRDSNEVEFALSFIESKFTSFVTLDVNKVIGIISKDVLKEFEKTKFIPYFMGEYKELEFFVTFFEIDRFDLDIYDRMLNIFERFYLKPSFEEKHYVHYSMIENKIIDFEAIEKEKIKKEYAFVYDLNYPELDLRLRKEIKNIQFILTVLDRIDSEIKEIKKSKGTIIVVKRIISFIHKNQLDPQIQEMTELISQELDREEYIIAK